MYSALFQPTLLSWRKGHKTDIVVVYIYPDAGDDDDSSASDYGRHHSHAL